MSFAFTQPLADEQGTRSPAHLPQGKHGEAEPLYRRAMTITERTLGTNHPSYAIDLNNLAGLLKGQVRYEERGFLLVE